VSRTLAGVVDAGVLAVSLGIVYLAAAGLVFAVDPVRFSFPVPSRVVVVSAGISLALVYFTLCWTMTGRTLGSQLLGLRVIDRNGRPPRFWRALVRAVGCVFFPLGLLWVVVSAGRRSVQDAVARTSVIYDWNPHS
jgi:uncharacterized RDD family membrane protein YckC